ncbi:hypothetical protein K8I61_01555 [bacterium]|nr:hypothetical protein [bacterium]
MSRATVFGLGFLLVLAVFPAAAIAQDAPAGAGSPHAATASTDKLPWFVMAGRLAFGGGGGSMNVEWEAYDGLIDYDEDVDFSAGQAALGAEAFFMPTRGRHFIISGSLLFVGGGGELGEGDRVFDGEAMSYSAWFLNLGLGYQWFFGAEERINLFLMSHLGPGQFQMTVDFPDEERTTEVLPAWDFDISAGTWYRFPSHFVLGGSLDFYSIGFGGDAGSEGAWDATIRDGGMGGARLNLIIGGSFH